LLAGKISGKVTDEEGNILPYASIVIKGTDKGTTANNEGKYFLFLEAGEYTICCYYVGYEKQEQSVSVTGGDVFAGFRLSVRKSTMAPFIVKAGAEDPAYEIIRHALRKRILPETG